MQEAIYTLNIGLQPSPKITTRKTEISRAEVLAALRGAGYFVLSYAEAQSHTERTAVVTITAGSNQLPFVHGLYNVSVALAQDCIAIQDNETGDGLLIGPNADAWGEFNPEYFITVEQAQAA